jgi:hypothetical protein
MKKIILSEVNRTREIMGLKPLILEQSSLLKFFRGLIKAGDTPITALGKTVRKEFGDLGGALIPITKLLKNSNMVEVLSDVMKNTNTIIRNNGQALSKRFKGVGIEISESQANSLGKAWTKGEDEFLVAVNRIARETMEDISTILIKGNPSEFQKPLIDAISGVVKVKNLDEFRMVLKQIEIPEDQITKIMNNISTSGTIGGKGKLEIIFGSLLEHPNYQDDMLKLLKNSEEFQKLVRKDFKVEDLATMMGRKADDPVVKVIYQKAIKLDRWEKIGAGFGKVWEVLTKTKVGKGIMYYFYITLGMNLLYEAMYGLKGKGKAGITPKVYTDVMGSKEFVERGGLTDAEATDIAERIHTAIYEYGALASLDNQIKDIYNKEIKSILAASQVSYFYEKLPETSGTLEKALNRLNIEITPKQFNLPDFTIEDVVDILETKPWVDQEGVSTTNKFKEVLKKNWPRYRVTLNSHDGGEWHTRKTGPIDGLLLGALLEGCTDSEEDCLDEMRPEDFNAIMSTVFQNPPVMYTETKPANTEAEDEETFFDSWVEVLDDESKASEIFKDVKNMAN